MEADWQNDQRHSSTSAAPSLQTNLLPYPYSSSFCGLTEKVAHSLSVDRTIFFPFSVFVGINQMNQWRHNNQPPRPFQA